LLVGEVSASHTRSISRDTPTFETHPRRRMRAPTLS
jgi:hypothetical protein